MSPVKTQPNDTNIARQGEVESTERWVSGKAPEQLLSDLQVYAAQLRENPHSVYDRLRVAAIQMRLGRFEEAMVHYEGVMKAYARQGQMLNAIALCRRLVRLKPESLRLKQLLAALYAHAPHGCTSMRRSVTPVQNEQSGFLLSLDNEPTTQELPRGVVDRLFTQPILLDRPVF